MPSPKGRIFKRSPRNQNCCKLSPKDVVVRKGRTECNNLPQQNFVSSKGKELDLVDVSGNAGEFIWHKKIQNETDGKLPGEELGRNQKRKVEENAKELAELKRRRKERENIRFEARERKYEEERSKIAETELCWSQEQEEAFFRKQVPLRSQIRLQQGRGKPVDFLARYVTAVNQLDAENMETEVPWDLVSNLTEEDLEDLAADVKVYKTVHLQPNYQAFWNRMEKIVNFQLSYFENGPLGRLRPLNGKIEEEIKEILGGKLPSQLECLKGNIEDKLCNSKHLDVSFWERLLQHIEVANCRQKIQQEHKTYLLKMMAVFQNQKKKIATSISAPSCLLLTNAKYENKSGNVSGATVNAFMEVKERFIVPCKEDEAIYTKEYSIPVIPEEDLPDDVVVVDAEEDRERLRRSRERVIGGCDSKATNAKPMLKSAFHGTVVLDEDRDQQNLKETRKRVEYKAKCKDSKETSVTDMGSLGAMDLCDGESEFNLEIPIQKHGCETDDKYRPRKPRYFNKIQTGFFWTRYNRTHYDSDHPPPKMVLGYRFNIFYPDLMDISVMPRYSITPCKDNGDLAIIRFSAGPPYEDVAFQIVNDREWDKSERHGFRNWYRGGILQLWFRFKKMSYRR